MRLWLYVLTAALLVVVAVLIIMWMAIVDIAKADTYDYIGVTIPIELPDNYTSQPTELPTEQLIERLKHDIWHLQQKQGQYYEAWQGCLQELIDSGLYEIYIEVSSENVTLRSYRKVPCPVQVPVEVEVFRELTDWNSVEELEAFLEQDNTDERILLKAGSDGVIKFNRQCEDYALQLRDRAMAQGKHLSIAIIELGGNKFHALCMARIGNEFWYIEPRTDECWLFCYLD